jgi:hypothetical protein
MLGRRTPVAYDHDFLALHGLHSLSNIGIDLGLRSFTLSFLKSALDHDLAFLQHVHVLHELSMLCYLQSRPKVRDTWWVMRHGNSLNSLAHTVATG